MAGLFDKAKKTAAPKKTKAKDEKARVRVTEDGFFEKIQQLETLNDRMKADKARADIIHEEIKEVGKIEWAKMYDEKGKNPGSIMIEAKNKLDIAQFMFLPSDKYITINEERANYLIETFGEDSVQEETAFSFDKDMVNKYGEIISTLIEESLDINDEDKEKIIKAVTTYTVAKGAVDKFKDFAKESEMDIFDVSEELKPVISIKNVEVLKG